MEAQSDDWQLYRIPVLEVLMSQTSLNNENFLSLPWAAFCTGNTPTDDYQAVHSVDAKLGFVQEATRLCQTFHSACQTEAPPEKPVVLFWRSVSGEWVLTRVTHTSKGTGARTALDYYSVAMNRTAFREVGHNPMIALQTDLFDQVREQHAQGHLQPVLFPLTLARKLRPVPEGTEELSHQFEVGGRFAADSRHQQALERYCDLVTNDSRMPPTFATWWPSGRNTPEGVFHIVLQAESEASPRQVAFALNAAVKEVLPDPLAGDASTSTLFQKIYAAAGKIQSLVDAALQNANSDAPEEWEERFGNASQEALLISADLLSYSKKLKGVIEADVSEQLNDLSSRYDHFSQVLARWKHQPFRPPFPQPTLTKSPGSGGLGQATPQGSPRNRYKRLGIFAVVVALIITPTWMKLSGNWPAGGRVEQQIVNRAENRARNTARDRAINRVRNRLLDAVGNGSSDQMKALAPVVEQQVKDEVNQSVISDVSNEMLTGNRGLNEVTKTAMMERIRFGARIGAERGAAIGSRDALTRLENAPGNR